MNKKKVEEYRKILNNQLASLYVGGDKAIATLQDMKGSPADPNDRASLETDRGFELRIRDREQKLMKKIKDALSRIEDGTYGVCEECGNPIEEPRLKARPVTTQCIECKRDAEAREPKRWRT